MEKMLKKIYKVLEIIFTFLNKQRFKKFGKNSRLGFGCILTNPHLIEIENDVFIGDQVWLNAGEGFNKDAIKLYIKRGSHISRFCHINAFNKVVIEEDVLIAENVYIGDADHKTSEKERPIIKQGITIKGKVIIKNGSFICKNAVINAGTVIGKNSIIAPNAVVIQKNIPDYSFVIGNPSRVLKRNFK
jgi:acetyltransferase-like isoleucine patch superfamily enzyme